MNYILNVWKFKEMKSDKDYLLKFYLWAYHWIVNKSPNDDAYVSNNLFQSWMKLKDVSATRTNAVRDWAFTVALKLYFNK